MALGPQPIAKFESTKSVMRPPVDVWLVTPAQMAYSPATMKEKTHCCRTRPMRSGSQMAMMYPGNVPANITMMLPTAVL